MKRIECVILGRVQMVMFRDFAKRNARRLGIFGSAQNLSDGSVRIVAEGRKERVEEFIALLKKGPVFARVDSLEIQWSDTDGTYTAFSIVY